MVLREKDVIWQQGPTLPVPKSCVSSSPIHKNLIHGPPCPCRRGHCSGRLLKPWAAFASEPPRTTLNVPGFNQLGLPGY